MNGVGLTPWFADSGGIIYSPKVLKGRSMIEVVKNDINIHYPLIDKIKIGQSIRGWNGELDSVLMDSLLNAAPTRVLSVGGGTIPTAKREFYCDPVQFEFELAHLVEARDPTQGHRPWKRMRPSKRLDPAFKVRKSRLPPMASLIAPWFAEIQDWSVNSRME